MAVGQLCAVATKNKPEDAVASRIDSGEGWVVTVAALAIASVCFGAPHVVTVALKPMAADLGGYRSIPSAALSLAMLGTGIGGLAMGWLADRTQGTLYSLLCVPMAVGGLGVAAFHEYLVLSGKLECPLGLFGIGTAPAQSLALFSALTVVVVWGAWQRMVWIAPAIVLGIVLA